MNRITAFTLIEVMAAVLIMALLAGAATLTFVEPLRRATAREALERVASFDDACRRYASRFGRDGGLVYSLADGKGAMRVGAGGGNSRSAGPSPLRLPRGVWIDRVRMAGPNGREVAFGEVRVPLSHLGVTPTYALRLAGAGLDSRWLVLAGLGGNVTEASDEHEVDRIFAVLESPDAGDMAAPPAARDDAR